MHSSKAGGGWGWGKGGRKSGEAEKRRKVRPEGRQKTKSEKNKSKHTPAIPHSARLQDAMRKKMDMLPIHKTGQETTEELLPLDIASTGCGDAEVAVVTLHGHDNIGKFSNCFGPVEQRSRALAYKCMAR